MILKWLQTCIANFIVLHFVIKVVTYYIHRGISETSLFAVGLTRILCLRLQPLLWAARAFKLCARKFLHKSHLNPCLWGTEENLVERYFSREGSFNSSNCTSVFLWFSLMLDTMDSFCMENERNSLLISSRDSFSIENSKSLVMPWHSLIFCDKESIISMAIFIFSRE